jgi:hypothetical protein
MKIKICGIAHLEDAFMAVEAGADMLGFNFYPRSPRYIDHAACAGIIRRLPSGEYIEVTQPLPEQQQRVLAMQLGHDLPDHGALPSGNGHGPNGHGPNGDDSLVRPVGALARARTALEGFFFERHGPEAGPDDDEPKTLTRP